MRTIFALFVIVLATTIFPAEAECSLCRHAGKECRFDIQCGLSCLCYISKYDLEGICVPDEDHR